MNKSNVANSSLFSLEGKTSLTTALPLSIQHLLAMIVGNVLPALVLAGAIGLEPAQQIQLVQASMFIAAIGTFIQTFPILGVGAKLPIIMGVSFAYIPTILAIGVEYGMPAIFGAQIVGGIVAYLVGIFIKRIRKYFPPMVAGTVVFTIGLSCTGWR